MPILKSGKKGAIKLDPKNFLRREWCEGSRVADKLAKSKTVLKCKNGVVQIDKDHPNYDFWMEN